MLFCLDSATNSLLSLHALAFDNDPTSPSNLSPLFRETMDGIVAGSEGHPEKTAVVLVDQDGEDDTRIYVVQDGIVTPIDGLPDSGGLLDAALHEYQMTDGATLGGFIKWAREVYEMAGTKTTFSYVGHGTFLVPAVDLGEMISDNRSSVGGGDLFPLTEINVKSSFTDKSPEYALITPHALQVALEVGTDGGNNPLEVLDVVHCFSGSLEELYELSNASGTPYASTMVASANYSYFAPEMLGEAFAALDGSASATEMASSIMSAYDAAVDEADQADGDTDVEHPRTMVVVDSSLLPALKARIDEMAWYLAQAFDSQPLETKDKLFAAYNGTGTYYDSDYCPPQAWELGAPDGLVDSAAFLRAIAGQNISSGVTLRALQAAALVESAVIERTVRNGVPWFAEPLTPNWTFDGPNASGLALYADLQGIADGDNRIISWHARFYTDTTSIGEPNDNPFPYLFVQGGFEGQTWADVFERYWEVKSQDEGLTVESVGCLPEFPPLVQEGELAAEQSIFPVLGTIHVGYPTKLAVAVGTEENATNPLITFNAYDSANTLVYSDTVGAGYLVAGTHYVEASTPWTPASSGIFTLEMIVDSDNSFLETNESDNITTTVDAAFADTPFEMTATTLDNRQWFDTQTIDLQITAEEAIDTLIVQIYEYVPAAEPNTQLPAKTHELYFTSPLLPNFSFDLPDEVKAGALTLHLWGISQSGQLNQQVAIVDFNYNPMSTVDMGSDYFTFKAEGGNNLELSFNVMAGEAKLYIWSPRNPWTAEMVSVQAGQTDAITFNSARAGKYLIAVEGQAIGTEYTISSQHNRAPSAGSNQLTVQKRQPTFTEPIPEIPSEQIPATIATTVILQGRNDVPPPHPRLRVPLTVTLTIPGESSPRYSFTPTTDEYGRFSMTGIDTGSYEVRVKKATTLQKLLTHDFVAGSNNLDVGTLYEGDANNNNYVNILDFSILASAFGTCEGDPDFEPRADFNGDGCITILDFSLLASNFGQGGLKEPAQEPTTSQASMNGAALVPERAFGRQAQGAALLVEALTNAVNVGDIFTATVLVQADNQAIDGTQISLNFDPAAVEVEHLSGGNRLALELLNQFDNSSGTIDFAAGSLVDFPSGAIELLHIQFKALAATESMTLAFQFDPPRESDITFGGSSVLSTHTNGTIIVQPAPTAITVNRFDAANWEPLSFIRALLLTLTAIMSLLIGWRSTLIVTDK